MSNSERPTCLCHNLRMQKNGYHRDGTQRWQCPVSSAKKHAVYYLRNRERVIAQQREYHARKMANL